MRKAAFTLFGALLMAGATLQMAAASGHHIAHRSGHHRWDRSYNQLRDPSFAVPQVRQGYDDGKPPANEFRSCDSVWCYAD